MERRAARRARQILFDSAQGRSECLWRRQRVSELVESRFQCDAGTVAIAQRYHGTDEPPYGLCLLSPLLGLLRHEPRPPREGQRQVAVALGHARATGSVTPEGLERAEAECRLIPLPESGVRTRSSCMPCQIGYYVRRGQTPAVPCGRECQPLCAGGVEQSA